jgi:hypothetical protein
VSEQAAFYVSDEGTSLCAFFVLKSEPAILARLGRPISDWEEWPNMVEESDYDAEKAGTALVAEYGGHLVGYEPGPPPEAFPSRAFMARFPSRGARGR